MEKDDSVIDITIIIRMNQFSTSSSSCRKEESHSNK